MIRTILTLAILLAPTLVEAHGFAPSARAARSAEQRSGVGVHRGPRSASKPKVIRVKVVKLKKAA